MKTKILLLIAIMWIAIPCYAQHLPCHIEHYSTENGLPQNTVMDIMQDKKGFIWFATWDGVSKFDGQTFRNYKVHAGDTYQMNSNRIESFEEDRWGNIWMRSYDGAAHCFDPRTETFRGLQSVAGYGEYTLPVSKIKTEKSGRIWLITEGKGCVCVLDSSFAIRDYSIASGQLKGNTVYSVFEDGDSNSWIMTNNGLYMVEKGSSETVSFFSEDSKDDDDKQSFYSAIELGDEIWFGANRGRIWRYGKTSKQFLLLETPASREVTGFSSLDGKEVAIATSGNGLYVFSFNDKNFRTFKEVSNADVEIIMHDSRNQLWFVTDGLGIYKLDANTGRIKFFHVKPEDINMVPYPSPPMVIEDIYGQIWVHPKGGGFSIYDRRTDSLEPFYNNANSAEWMFSNILHVAFTDRQGNLWLSTHSNGLEKIIFSSNSFEAMVINPETKSSTANEVRAILQDKERNIWIATKNCVVAIYDGDFNRLGNLGNDGRVSKGSLLSGVVYGMMQDDEGNIWLGTRNDGLFKVRRTGSPYRYEVEHFRNSAAPNSISDNAIYCIFQDSKKNIWVGTYGGGINLVGKSPLDGKTVFLNYRNGLKGYPIEKGHRVRFISENRFGNICVGTTAGLIMFSANLNSDTSLDCRYYSRIAGDRESLSGNDVHWICNTQNGEMFIATFGGGINKVAAVDEEGFPLRFKSYSVRDGLPSDVCLAILEDGNGKLWISADNTLSKFEPKEETFETFSEVRRAISRFNFSEASAITLDNGDMAFGYLNGILKFSPGKIRNSDFKPYISLSDFRLFNQPVPVKKGTMLDRDVDDMEQLTLKHNENFFSLRFTALDFILSGNILYAYKLEGFDHDWVYPQRQQTANYTNIPKGRYILRVKSTNHEGIWTDNERQLVINVLPSFMETPWAYIIYVLIFMLAIFLIIYLSSTFYRLKVNVTMEKQMSEIKLKFFTDISHEIRTPLTMIAAPVEYMLGEEDTPEKIKRQLGMIEVHTNRLLRLVNQILDFRKVQQFKLQVQETVIGEAVEAICRNFEEPAIKRGITFSFSNNAPNETVWIDRDCLEKIMMNLLSNAFKYTPDNRSIQVNVKGGDKHITVDVIDRGKGISKERQKNLFARFASFNDDKSQPSTGIGLFIVKDLVDRHGGKVTVESAEGEGAAFAITFLRGTAHFGSDVEILQKEQGEKLLPAMPETSSGSKPVVLVVEDDDALRDFIRTILEPDYFVVEAMDGEQGWQKASAASPPDFIVSDVMMPGMDGVELLRLVKENVATSHIPVLLLTAKTAMESKLEGLASGADDYITKPFSVPYFKARISNIMEQRKRLQDLFRSRIVDFAIEEKPAEEASTLRLSPKDEILLDKVAKIIEANMDNPDFTVEDLSMASGMSRSVFFNKIKGLTGFAPVEFIRDLKMCRAARLLATEDLLVKEVSYTIGISDTKYFGRCFKAKYGMSPQEYKAKHRS